MYKLDLEKAENQRSTCQHLLDHRKTNTQRRIPEKHLPLLTDYAKAFNCGSQLWKILKKIGISVNHTCLLRNLYAGQEATLQTRHGIRDWFKLGKEYIKAVYYHTEYLTYMHYTSCKMPGWMKYKL